MPTILLLEDDESFGYILSEYLTMHDFQVIWRKTGASFLDTLPQTQVDLAVLDIMMPGMDGFEVAQRLSQQAKDLPFIFLSAKSLKVDKLKGYKLGAYDYLTKPVDEEVLVAKIHALLRQVRRASTRQDAYHLGAYTFFPDQYLLHHPDQDIQLTAREADLLSMMCERKGSLLPRKETLIALWGANDAFNRKSMDVFVSKLRKYLRRDASIHIDNVHGKGFILRDGR